jgi:hypothetical protein
VCVWFTLGSGGAGSSGNLVGVMLPANQDQQAAMRLWEQAIAAKGGREKLFAIRNILFLQQGAYRPEKFSTRGNNSSSSSSEAQVRTAGLYVFPDKFWDCEDYRPGEFGVIMHMYNYETGKKYIVTLGEPEHPSEPIEPSETRQSRTYGLVAFLLETTWLKPIPLRTRVEKIGNREFDLVQTSVNRQRIDFAFDRETHLPAQIRYYSDGSEKSFMTETLSNYTNVDGVPLPQTVKEGQGPKYKVTIDLNVSYEPDIFVRPPAITNGLDAWRPKRKN